MSNTNSRPARAQQLNSLPFNAPHFQPADWKVAFEDEFKRREALQSEVATLKRRLAVTAEAATTAEKNIQRSKSMRTRNNDLRRAIAARVLGALMTGKDIGNTDIERLCDLAVSASDELILALEVTATPRERHR